MESSDARFVMLVGTAVLGRALQAPSIALGGAITVGAWHGFELGRQMIGWSPANNIGTLFMLGFVAFLLCTLWALMSRVRKKGKSPVVDPAFFLVLLGSLVVGFAGGLASKVLLS